MPFWTLYTWVFACIEIYYKHNGPEKTVRENGHYEHNKIENIIILQKSMPKIISTQFFQPSPSNVCKDFDTMEHVGHYLQYLGYMNSFINPFIYTGFNQEFRTLFRNILTYIKLSFVRCLSFARLNKIPAEVL